MANLGASNPLQASASGLEVCICPLGRSPEQGFPELFSESRGIIPGGVVSAHDPHRLSPVQILGYYTVD